MKIFSLSVQSDYEMELARLKEQYKGKLEMAETQCKYIWHQLSALLATAQACPQKKEANILLQLTLLVR